MSYKHLKMYKHLKDVSLSNLAEALFPVVTTDFPNLSMSKVEKTMKGSVLAVAYRKKFLSSPRVPVTLAFSVSDVCMKSSLFIVMKIESPIF